MNTIVVNCVLVHVLFDIFLVKTDEDTTDGIRINAISSYHSVSTHDDDDDAEIVNSYARCLLI